MTAARKLELNGTMMVALDPATYHADPTLEPSLSSSIAVALATESALHGWSKHPRLGGMAPAPTQSTERGDLMHALLLGKGKSLAIIKADDYKTAAAREARDAARAAGKLPVLEERLADAESACRIIKLRLDELGVKLNPKRSEMGMLWVDHASDGTPVQCRALLDNWAPPIEYDIKTIGRISRDAIANAVIDYGAHVQRAAYRRGLEANCPKLVGRIQQRLLFVESNPPFDVVPVRLPEMLLEVGEQIWKRALDVWTECSRTGRWPGVLGESEVLIPDVPAWYLKRFEDSDGERI